jgi:diadenosine tetraphosphatase ApaH/serine/threonine PP2A family protein phosphatase
VRTAILTDIHGNLTALKRVLARCRELGVERYVCLGDTVGYGSWPNECCEIIRERASFSLLGNHDAAVAGRMSYDEYYDLARTALDWTRDVLSAGNEGWLLSLPYTVREGWVAYCHGSPIEPEQFDYIFQPEHALELMPALNDLAELTLIGHSHLSRVFALGGGRVRSLEPDVVQLQPGTKYLISVGSAGQPRDGDPRACFAVLDDEARTVTFVRVEYDIKKTATHILSAGLPSHFAQRLFAGI